MRVRKLLAEDAGAFQAIRLEGLLESPSAFSSSHAEEVNEPLSAVAERMAPRPDGAVLGCFARSDLAGIIGVQRERQVKLAHKAFIWGLYVAPAHRRCGVGRKLVEAALEFASMELGVLSVNLGVNTTNSAAVALYEALGFVRYGTEKGFLQLDGVLHDEHLMKWTRPGAASTSEGG